MSFFISEALAQAPAAAADAPGWQGLIFPLGLVVIFYFFLIRPQMKRAKEHKKLVDELQKGDEVQLQAGMMGKITDLTDVAIDVEVAEGIVLKFRRAAVEAVLPKGSLKEM
ncbi:preprotein translocase subunit YajC [Solemya velum gill symbiont]|uniref:Sec translocon accessory complex subunit YajC n=1 Tax=Solemya velum gill symbiont TaxID=2340 RepID=A0A0B0H8C5_SOVGS|nr:preprotein translocase subunit YajC [Solemya velum gill symbiont]KHF24872.1 protein translocase SecABDEFGY-YidC-YajC-Ffh-FtsY, subunit YajC [Solemya velum gill symbiont]OOY35030.1 preprotein translocase subunit YajC [Solemya velum gill symbiont]OOY37732.1 preprotein translocase subunit YajC [Solemya velum gill symbiont]OOY40604.1 preprotein translocase subunit YajC [Solemya velum gill symbiont]OOY42854.1 preprotein translocase subunit YajC [Solemya velum gill symbiont]